MAKLKPGALIIDLVGGGIYGDVEHCGVSDLLESAEALMALLPTVQHKGLWGMAKSFDADCYIHTTQRSYRMPDEWCEKPPRNLGLEADMYRGQAGFPASRRNIILVVFHGSREDYFTRDWYSTLFGSVKGGKVTTDTEGIQDMVALARGRYEAWEAEAERRKPPKQLAMPLGF